MVSGHGIESEHGIGHGPIGQHLRAVRAARSAASSVEPQRWSGLQPDARPLSEPDKSSLFERQEMVLMRGIEPAISEVKARRTGHCPT
jgi:hypothetical protein